MLHDDHALTSSDPFFTQFLAELGLGEDNLGCYVGAGVWRGSGPTLVSRSPATGKAIARVAQASDEDYEAAFAAMEAGRKAWAETPAPVRGEIVRQIADALRAKKAALGALVSLEMGKITSEGLGEVQETIDTCDMACGMSRTIAGQVIPSERPGHTLLEVWNPLGHVGIVTAFNFPHAVLGWNLTISMIAGNTNMWKGASTTPLVTLVSRRCPKTTSVCPAPHREGPSRYATASLLTSSARPHTRTHARLQATTRIVAAVLEANNLPTGILTTVIGSGRTIGERLISDPRFSLVSFTGSTEIGEHVSTVVHSRFGRTILELGGNNASIVMPDANMDLALRACVFGAVGTAGQRCTSLRRLLIHSSVYDAFVARMVKAYATIPIGDPLQPHVLMGPLHTPAAVKEYVEGLEEIARQGGKVLCGGKPRPGPGNFVEPTIVVS